MKRIASIAFILLIAMSPVPASAVILQGDIDNSGKVDLRDAVVALQICSEINVSIPVYLSADVNGDQKIGLAEALYALQCAARLRNNHSPVLNPIGNQAAYEGASLSFNLTATDGDGDSLTYTAAGLPAGAQINPITGTFTWTPTYGQSGVYPVTFHVRDDYGGTDSFSITITVNNVNQPPVLNAIGDKTVDESSLLSFTIYATDADGDALTYSASTLPSGASFDAATRTFSWTPTYSQSGAYQVTFRVSDGFGGFDIKTITITVKDKIVTIAAAEYFPLNIGDWMDYRQSSTGIVHRTTVTGPRYIGSVPTKEVTYWNGLKDYYTSDANGVKLYGEYIVDPNYTGDVYFNAPLLLMPNNAQIGTTQVSYSTYSLNLSGYLFNVNITSTTTVWGLEDVQTANMILKDCVKVSVRLDQYIVELQQPVPGGTVYYWFYKGVGCVKQIVDNDIVTITRSYVNGIQQTY